MDFWQQSLDSLRKIVSEQEFRIWFLPLRVTNQGNLFTIYAPNQYFLDWIKSKYKSRIIETLKKLKKSEDVSVRFSILSDLGNDKYQSSQPSRKVSRLKNKSSLSSLSSQTDLFKEVQGNKEISNSRSRRIVSQDDMQEIDIDFIEMSNHLSDFDELNLPTGKKNNVDFGSPLKKEYSFDNFIVGKANEISRAAAMQVSVNPGFAYNPLFIYGGSGLGKTHLMHAIGNYVLHNSPNSKVLYVTSERFVKDYVDAVRLHSGDEFQDFYRSVDVLLVDDIHFIAGKSGSQEEFFHTFNTLLENGKQVVLSCDKYPKEIPKLEERLVSRFGYGLTVTIDIPDLETRSAILLNKSTQFGRPIDQNVAFFMAKHIRSNVRELEGALRRVLNYAQFNKKSIDENFAYECLKDVISIQEKIVKIDNIQRVVADYYKIKVTDLLSKQKKRDVARPRQVAMALAKEFTNHSLPEIGGFFGGRDHTTVLHAVKTVKRLVASSFDFKDDYQTLSRKLSH